MNRMCSSGRLVLFEEGASYILNLATGELNWLREELGNYMLDVWIVLPRELPAESCLARQP